MGSVLTLKTVYWTDRRIDIQTPSQTKCQPSRIDRQKVNQMRQTDRQLTKQTDIKITIRTDIQTVNQPDCRQTADETDRQKNSQPNIQTEIATQTYRRTPLQINLDLSFTTRPIPFLYI